MSGVLLACRAGAVTGPDRDTAAGSVRVEHSPAGQRLVVAGTLGEVRYEQWITLWYGLDRLDLRTRVLGFDGADRLLRVAFGCDVSGARPVSEVAGAVVGRGFGLVEVDSARAPWTLDNPCNTFFALSSTAALRLATPRGTPLGRTALGVVEVVVPELAHAARDARALVVALARVGVTATTSTATGPRYGWLLVDSNLPDLRIVLGGPDTNPLAEQVLRQAGPRHREELRRQLAQRGAARLLVPGRTSVEDAWVPNADLRAPDALPALLIAGADPARLAAEIADLAAQFSAGACADTVVAAAGVADLGPLTLLDQHTVGLLNRGLPGFAVDPQGGMHLSLMRSCSGWPSGVWIDPPLRRAPDGSAFQLQHWTHDFDYALVSGPGDWRGVDLVARGHGFTTPLLATVGAPHPGRLPDRHSLLSITPERRVQLQALKPAGNPHAVGVRATERTAAGVTLRLVETTGLPATAVVRSHLGWVGGYETDLLERERRARVGVGAGGVLRVGLDGARIATVLALPGDGAAVAGGELLGPGAEAAQPVFCRFWLHNRGPAPMGFLPVSVTVRDTVQKVAPGASVTLAVTVASHLAGERFDSTVRVLPPEGWPADPAQRPLSLAADGHTVFPLTLTVPDGASPGLYFARVQLAAGADLLEDVVTLVLPGSACDEVLPPPPQVKTWHRGLIKGTGANGARPVALELSTPTRLVDLAPGECGTLSVAARSLAASGIEGEAMLAGPWGSWGLAGPYTQGFRVAPGESTQIRFPVRAPAGAEPGTWWVMVKLMWFGRVQYSESVQLRVRAR